MRRGSHNRRLIRAAGDTLPSGVELVEWDGLGGLPIFDEDMENDPPAEVQDLLDAIEAADALLIATPEYNGSVPEQLAVRAFEAGVARRACGEERAAEAPVAMRALHVERAVPGRGVGHLTRVAAGRRPLLALAFRTCPRTGCAAVRRSSSVRSRSSSSV